MELILLLDRWVVFNFPAIHFSIFLPPLIPIGKHTKEKAPARSNTISVLYGLQNTTQRTYNSLNMVRWVTLTIHPIQYKDSKSVKDKGEMRMRCASLRKVCISCYVSIACLHCLHLCICLRPKRG